MKLLGEYLNQQKWRSWDCYLSVLPFDKADRVIDLGCSVGEVSRLLSKRVESVLGVDQSERFVEYCNLQKSENEHYLCGDIADLDFSSIGSLDGVWASFSLSYLANPKELIESLYSVLNVKGWVAVVDVDCFVSGNLPKNSIYRKSVLEFERASYKSGVYDFSFGSKIEKLLTESGFTVVYADNDVSDVELNFDFAAPTEVVENWRARLDRLNGLKSYLSKSYEPFCNDLICHVSSNERFKSNNLRYVIAQKIK